MKSVPLTNLLGVKWLTELRTDLKNFGAVGKRGKTAVIEKYKLLNHACPVSFQKKHTAKYETSTLLNMPLV
jgi:hypothetical protein